MEHKNQVGIKELLRKASFGDKFKTRNGKMAIYLGCNCLGYHYFLIEFNNLDDFKYIPVDEYGRRTGHYATDNDIVEPYKE